MLVVANTSDEWPKPFRRSRSGLFDQYLGVHAIDGDSGPELAGLRRTRGLGDEERGQHEVVRLNNDGETVPTLRAPEPRASTAVDGCDHARRASMSARTRRLSASSLSSWDDAGDSTRICSRRRSRTASTSARRMASDVVAPSSTNSLSACREALSVRNVTTAITRAHDVSKKRPGQPSLRPRVALPGVRSPMTGGTDLRTVNITHNEGERYGIHGDEPGADALVRNQPDG
jgi:hypothetical protein